MVINYNLDVLVLWLWISVTDAYILVQNSNVHSVYIFDSRNKKKMVLLLKIKMNFIKKIDLSIFRNIYLEYILLSLL